MNVDPTQPLPYVPRKRSDGALYAALDLGTNNCRLLVAAIDTPAGAHMPVGLRVLDSFSRIVRLGEGISQTGVLSEEAMARTLAALSICKRKINKYDLKAVRLVATEACRKATNTPVFLNRVKEQLDLDIEVISNEEEARLAFLGCSSLLMESAHRAIVFDIGGGSTELMWIDVQEAHSRNQKGNKKADDGAPEKKVISDWLSIDSGVMNPANSAI
jgi:exopolyphosphatase/guanosine-5'-triphosphate,3'-diphosphate pyrophosphatase